MRLKKSIVSVLAALLVIGTCGCSDIQITDAPHESSAPEPLSATPAAETPEPTIPPTPEITDEIRIRLNGMTLEQKICQLFFVSPEAVTDADSFHTNADDLLCSQLSQYPVGGIILFGGHLTAPEQTRNFINGIRTTVASADGVAPFIAVDEEGGLVSRVASNSSFHVRNVGSMRDIGRSGSTAAAYDAAAYISSYLSELGFNVDFAPVADVLSNPQNTVVRERSFGTEPALVSEMVLAQLRAFSEHGIAACPKHFPGHGSTGGDTHSSMTYTEKSWDELLQCELIPFIDAVNAGAPMIMVGHFAVPAASGDYTPCSLSYTIITERLKNELGFDGLVITDDLSMAAVTLGFTPGSAAVTALNAGVDMLLMSGDFKEAYTGVLDAVGSGAVSSERVDEAVYKILRLKAELGI